jgi:translation initiation factor IF-3
MMIIDQNGVRVGVFGKAGALAMANSRGMDIVVVAPEARPMVAKLMDYSKFKFEQKKKMKEAKKNQHQTEVKEVQLSPNIADHDLDTKLKGARGFIEDGDKVKISMRMKGRLIAHKDRGKATIDRFIEKISDIAVVERKLELEGFTFYTTLMPKPKNK